MNSFSSLFSFSSIDLFKGKLGIYRLYTKEKELVYIGRSKTVSQRFLQHLNSEKKEHIEFFSFKEVNNGLDVEEQRELDAFYEQYGRLPRLNKINSRRKKKQFPIFNSSFIFFFLFILLIPFTTANPVLIAAGTLYEVCQGVTDNHCVQAVKEWFSDDFKATLSSEYATNFDCVAGGNIDLSIHNPLWLTPVTVYVDGTSVGTVSSSPGGSGKIFSLKLPLMTPSHNGASELRALKVSLRSDDNTIFDKGRGADFFLYFTLTHYSTEKQKVTDVQRSEAVDYRSTAYRSLKDVTDSQIHYDLSNEFSNYTSEFDLGDRDYSNCAFEEAQKHYSAASSGFLSVGESASEHRDFFKTVELFISDNLWLIMIGLCVLLVWYLFIRDPYSGYYS